MMRDSSPEPARTWPGATASTSTTSQPANAQWRASDAPNTPAPTTTSEGRLVTARRLAARGPSARDAQGLRGRARGLVGRHVDVADLHAPRALALELLLEGEGLVGGLEAPVDGLPLALALLLPVDTHLAGQAGARGLQHAAGDRCLAALADLDRAELDPRLERRGERLDARDLHGLRDRVALRVEGDDGDRVRTEGEALGALPVELDRLARADVGPGEVADLLAVGLEGHARDAGGVGGNGADSPHLDELLAGGRRADRQRRRVEVAARAAELVALRGHRAEGIPRGLVRAVGALQPVVVELVAVHGRVAKREPQPGLDVGVARQA